MSEDALRMQLKALEPLLQERLKVLEPLIRENYAARERGELPDEMFWADSEAFSYGYALNESGELEKI